MTVSSRPKVLYVGSVRFFSGSELLLVNFLRDNASIDSVLAAPDGPLLARASEMGIRVHRVHSVSELHRRRKPWWVLEFVARAVLAFVEFLILIARERPDMVHANNFAAALYALLPARFMGKAFVWHIYDIFPDRSIENRVLKALSRAATAIVVPSHASAERLARLGIPESRLHVLHNGVDCHGRFDPTRYEPGQTRQELGIGTDSVLIGMFGQLVELKGLHVFIDAIELLGATSKHARYLVVGSAPREAQAYLDANRRRVQESQVLRERVTFTGWRSDIPELMATSDVVVVPSILPDTLPTVVIEAMSLAKPVVGSRIGGIPEMIDHEVTGLLFQPGDASALASKLRSILENPKQTEEMGRLARRKAITEFDLERYRKDLLSIYRRVLDRSIPPDNHAKESDG